MSVFFIRSLLFKPRFLGRGKVFAKGSIGVEFFVVEPYMPELVCKFLLPDGNDLPTKV